MASGKEKMSLIAKIVSLVSMLAVSLPCLLLLAGTLDLSTVQGLALLGTFGWFASAPLWMGHQT